MSQAFRSALVFVLALALAAPAMSQPSVPPAAKGELVVVNLRDGRTITGAVGEWADTLGFQVIPADGVPYFVRVSEIVTITSAATGAGRGLPSRESRHRLGFGAGLAIGLAAPFVIGMLTYAIGCSKGCR